MNEKKIRNTSCGYNVSISFFLLQQFNLSKALQYSNYVNAKDVEQNLKFEGNQAWKLLKLWEKLQTAVLMEAKEVQIKALSSVETFASFNPY